MPDIKGLMIIKKRKAKPPQQQRKITEIIKIISQKKRIKLFIIIAFVSLIALFFFIGDRGTYKLFTFYNQKQDLVNEIEQVETEKSKLDTIQAKLKSDPEYIEKVAREKYKMKKKGERVYQVVEK